VSAQKIDHLGIAVRDLAAATKKFETLLGVPVGGTEEVPTESVRVAFLQVGESRVELLEPTSESSPIAKFLEKRGEGIHHVCLSVTDIKAEVERLRAAGLEFVGAAPRPGAGGHQVAFIHPRSAGGILVELSEGPGHHH
jgi:methylmalonyl-CoA epimerase